MCAPMSKAFKCDRAIKGFALAAIFASAFVGASPLEASDFVPARVPFAPQLVADHDAAVCTPFVEAVRREFFESNYAMHAPFDIDVTDRDWPGAQVRWLFPHNSTEVGFGERDLKLKRHQSAVIADLDRDGSPEALALFGWVHSWRGANYALVRYPSFETYLSALETDRKATPTDTVEPSDGRTSLSWNWARPSVVEIRGAFYLVDAGEVYHRLPTISLRRIPANGPAVETCRVLKWRPIETLGADAQPVRDFMATLRSIAGTTDGGCGGTSHPNAGLALAQTTVEALAITMPWALPQQPYNTRAVVDAELTRWSDLGLWNKRRVRAKTSQQAAAIDALARDYRGRFGLTASSARRQAVKTIDLVLRLRFVFPSSSRPPEPRSDRLTLQKMILDGTSPGAIERFLLKGEHVFTPLPPSHCESPLEPLLFAALERPRVMRLLLRHGAVADERNGFGKTALMTAAQFDLLPAARLLLSHGADVNARTSATRGNQNFKERTALMYAAENAGVPMIRLLIGTGADVAAVDSAKRDVFDYLSRNGTMTAQEREQAAAYLNAPARR